jgi:hypothetical protein
MSTDTEALLQDILARCAQEAARCLANGADDDLYDRALEMRMAASLAHVSARLADSLARLQKQAGKRGSNGT